MFLNPQGGTRASRLRGWHPRWEEAGTPWAGSIGWDVLLPVPMPVPMPGRAGRKRKSPGEALCWGPGTRWVSKRATAWGRHWERLWHRALAGVLEEAGDEGTPWGHAQNPEP